MIAAALFVATVSLALAAAYLRDICQARHLVALGSRLVDTAFGTIEYSIAGTGPALLIVHGAGGGFDQGLDLSSGLAEEGFRVIAVSRFGYLRTPVPPDPSPAAQADAFASLLDHLGVRRVAVIGASAGAPSSMQFALRHPDRTAALVLLVPAAYPPHLEQRPTGAMPQLATKGSARLFDHAIRSDFLFWLACRLAPTTIYRVVLGTEPDLIKGAGAEERGRVARELTHLLPVSARRQGILNDARITPSLPRYDLEHIAVPTLLLAAADDLYGTIDGARYSAAHIPGARIIEYPTGGHVLVGRIGEISSEVSKFLHQSFAWP